MNEEVLGAISRLSLEDVKLLAMVSDTMSSVVFYATVNGEKQQSNALAEEGIIDHYVLEVLEKDVASIIRRAKEYNPDQMNIVEVEMPATVKISYDAKDCRVYKIKKEWEMRIQGRR